MILINKYTHTMYLNYVVHQSTLKWKPHSKSCPFSSFDNFTAYQIDSEGC